MNRSLGYLEILLLLVSIIKGASAQEISSFSSGVLAFESVSNGQYRIEWKTDLTEPNWRSDSPFQVLTATQEATEVRMPQFFRVQWLNPPPYSIAGVIQFAGVPIVGITNSIQLIGAEYGFASNTVPDDNGGTFVFDNLTNGTYQLLFSHEGFFPYLSDVVVQNADVYHSIVLQMPIAP